MANEELSWIDDEMVLFLMSTVTGRKTVWAILSRCGIRQGSSNISDPLITAACEGARFVGFEILKALEEEQPSLTVMMYKENLDGNGNNGDSSIGNDSGDRDNGNNDGDNSIDGNIERGVNGDDTNNRVYGD